MIETNAQELTGDWRTFAQRFGFRLSSSPHAGPAPTQLFGGALFQAGFEGLISFSAKCPDRKILAVFPARLAAPSRLKYDYSDAGGHGYTVSIP